MIQKASGFSLCSIGDRIRGKHKIFVPASRDKGNSMEQKCSLNIEKTAGKQLENQGSKGEAICSFSPYPFIIVDGTE